jgi:nitroreductase
VEAFEAIRKRRSVRKYTGESIPRTDLEKIVDAGRLAASGYNRQPWVFVVVTEQKTLEQFRVVAKWIDSAAAVIAVVMDDSSQFWLEDASAAVENMLIASTALGYGSCWLEGNTLPHEDELKTVLGVPAEKRLLTLVSVGVPVEWPTRQKKPLREVLRWERYSV